VANRVVVEPKKYQETAAPTTGRARETSLGVTIGPTLHTIVGITIATGMATEATELAAAMTIVLAVQFSRSLQDTCRLPFLVDVIIELSDSKKGQLALPRLITGDFTSSHPFYISFVFVDHSYRN
jgi:hypothetical protein